MKSKFNGISNLNLISTLLYDWIKVEICIRRALYMYRLYYSRSFVPCTFPLGNPFCDPISQYLLGYCQLAILDIYSVNNFTSTDSTVHTIPNLSDSHNETIPTIAKSTSAHDRAPRVAPLSFYASFTNHIHTPYSNNTFQSLFKPHPRNCICMQPGRDFLSVTGFPYHRFI